MQKYIIEISIADTWIEDGFNISTNQDVKDLLRQLLPYAYDHEVRGKVIHKPDTKVIKHLQGYTK